MRLRWPRLTYRLHKNPRRSGRSSSAGLPILKHPTVARDRHVTDGAARSPRPWSDLDGDRPISRAWTRDTIGELLNRPPFRHGRRSRRKTDLILKLSVAATILIGLVPFQILQRQYNDAEAMIAANELPLDELVVPLATSETRSWR